MGTRCARGELVGAFLLHPATPHPPFGPQVYNALSQLIFFCTSSDDYDPLTRGGAPIFAHQQLLLDQNVHHIMMHTLKAAETHKHNVVSLLCFRVLRQMVIGCSTFALHLSQYIPYLQVGRAQGSAQGHAHRYSRGGTSTGTCTGTGHFLWLPLAAVFGLAS